jgi:hypothetical protein
MRATGLIVAAAPDRDDPTVIALLAAAAISPTPQALLTKLVETPIAQAELPAGYSQPKIARQSLGANGRRYHAVGQVVVLLAGPNRQDAFAWEVFKSHEDALGDLHHPALSNGTRIVGTVPGVKDGVLLRGQLNGLQLADAVTVVDNVLVQAVTASPQGNPAASITLLKTAIAHLKKVAGG